MAPRLRDAHRLFMQLGRVEPYRASHGLPMGKAGSRCHQRVAMLGGHLDKIAKHSVMPDFERGDSSRFTIARLHLRNRLTPVTAGAP